MDAIKQQLSKPIIAGIVGLVIGIIFGLVVLGWWLFPVQWEDATPAQLNHDWKVEYMRMAVEAFGYTQDGVTAQLRYQALGEDAKAILTEVVSDPGNLTTDLLLAFTGAALVEEPVSTEVGTPAATAPVEEATGNGMRTFLIIVCVIGLLAAAALFVFLYLRSRRSAVPVAETGEVEVEQPMPEQMSGVEYPYQAASSAALARFMAAYTLGNDAFDDSFSIESHNGEFLGECGVGISETIGVGDPKRITAFEVWLFDKNDIQTVTKVLMSSNAYNDGNTRQRLASRGEPVLVEPGINVELETQTLRLVARVVDMAYGDGALPSESFFSRFVLDLSVSQKA